MLWHEGVNVMIEIIYQEEQKNEENQPTVQIPKNIRQIGEIRGTKKIYVEDYAYTFLQKISNTPDENGKAAILFGVQCNFRENTYTFVKSALLIEDMEITKDHIPFTDEIWEQIYEKSKLYFQDQEIVGWFISASNINMQITEPIKKAHINYFAGADKVLLVADMVEKEENFWVYENNQMCRQSGYYIYYEKNEPMQSYMIAYSKNKSIEQTERVPDRVITDFRKVSQEKKEEKKSEEKQQSKYANIIMGACAAIAVFAIGSIYFQKQKITNESNGINITQNEKQQEEQIPVTVPETEVTIEPSVTMAPTQISLYDPEKTQENTDEDKQEQLPESDTQVNQTENVQETISAEISLKDKEYVIQRGDTLTSICKNLYGTISKIDEICELNEIEPEEFIYPGQKLLLP